MVLFILAYLGGVLTILSPCILPVLPFVFARADRSFMKGGLPMLTGMALAFVVLASLSVAGGWAVTANQYARLAAVILLGIFGIALLLPSLADRLAQPLVSLGARLSQSTDVGQSGVLSSALLGVATGLLWAPCAGPILGLILTGAALQGASIHTSLLLLAYALGAATSLSLALLVGGKAFAAMKRSLGIGEWVRRVLGVAVLGAVAAIAFGLDTGFLTQLSLASTSSLEQALLDRFQASSEPAHGEKKRVAGSGHGPTTSANRATNEGKPFSGSAVELPIEGTLPSLGGAVQWLNSAPLSAEALRGKIVLVDFWTYSCINCLRTIPYVRAWAEKYKDQGLVVIGVHTPEFAFEKDIGNVKKAVIDLKIDYPVAIDNNYAIWRAFNNRYWPAHYFIDAQGRIRYHHFGEGDYAESEHVIQQLLVEAGHRAGSTNLVSVNPSGAEAAPDMRDLESPETYIGYKRAKNFVSPGGAVRDMAHAYTAGEPHLNQWGLSGNWTITGEHALLNQTDGAIIYHFHARDLHLVLGPGPTGRPVHFRVTIDGAAPGASHGSDCDADGRGVVTGERLYQLVRQRDAITDHTFEIRFLDPGVEAYAFTFG
jgi:cytochrome c biogenesis protein CcdA/thiol-disulfide isomerase/thioredoxin